jgi:methionyl-tRNA synthetase
VHACVRVSVYACAHRAHGDNTTDIQPEDKAVLDATIYMALEALRVSGILLQPIAPELACTLLDRLAVPASQRLFEHAAFGRPGGELLPKTSGHLLKKIDILEPQQ